MPLGKNCEFQSRKIEEGDKVLGTCLKFFVTAIFQIAFVYGQAKAAEFLNAEMAVQKQFDAYNAHDIEAFLEVYAEDVELYRFPATLQTKGRMEMRERYTARFKSNVPHATIVSRIVMGNTVVDHERVGMTMLGEQRVVEVIAIYEIRGSKIPLCQNSCRLQQLEF